MTQIDYVFQSINEGWLTLPNITIEHRTTGRIRESQIESVSMLDAKYIEHEMAKTAPYYIKEFHLITPGYDRENGIVWMKLDMSTDKDDVTALMAMFPTELGVLFVSGTAATAGFPQYEATFRAGLSSINVDPSIAYRFSLFRRIMQPSTTVGAAGILLMWIVVLIGGALLIVYVARNWLSG